MRGKRFGKVHAKRRENLTEEKQNQAEQRDGNGRSNTKMSRLAESAAWLIVPAGMRVRHNLQQEENGNERQRKGDTRR